MTTETPKFPDSLPPPTAVVEESRHAYFVPDDFNSAAAIADLVHDLYWFPDTDYCLFFVYGEGIGAGLEERLKAQGVATRKTEMYFYRHPNPAHENDFIRILPHSAEHEWVIKAAQGQMYGRVLLSLEPWRKKQLDLEHAGRAAARTIADAEPVIEMKPNFAGMGVNIHSALRRLKRWFNVRRGR